MYVDDFKLSGPEKTSKQAWTLLRQGFVIELESRIGGKEIVYLGCTQRCFSLMLASGRIATVMSYDVEEFLESCVAKYCGFAKIKSPLRQYRTPIIP